MHVYAIFLCAIAAAQPMWVEHAAGDDDVEEGAYVVLDEEEEDDDDAMGAPQAGSNAQPDRATNGSEAEPMDDDRYVATAYSAGEADYER